MMQEVPEKLWDHSHAHSSANLSSIEQIISENLANMSLNSYAKSANLTISQLTQLLDQKENSDPALNNITDYLRKIIDPNNYPAEYRTMRAIRQYTIITCYMMIIIVSLFGNLFVCYVILKRKRMRTSTNLLMANLALSDFLMTLLIPLNILRIFLNSWPFGRTLCVAVPLVQVTSVYVSTLTMTIISIDRYLAIMRPLDKRISTSVPICLVVCLIWLVSFLFSIPTAAFNQVVTLPVAHLVRCKVVYPKEHKIAYSRILTMFCLVTQYCIPLAITAYAYVRISFYIWHKLNDPTESCSSAATLSTDKTNGHNGQANEFIEQNLSSAPPSQLENLKRTCYYTPTAVQIRERSRRKSIRILSFVVIVFFVCWAPLNFLHFIYDFVLSDQIGDSNLFLFCHWLAMCSVCANPFIYFWLNRHFRKELKRVIFCCTNEECLKGAAPNFEKPVQDKNENNNNQMAATVPSPYTRVRYVPEKPAHCKILFRSRYTDMPLPLQMSSSSSGPSSSSERSRNKSKLRRSNAVRIASSNSQLDASSNRWDGNHAFNSMHSSRSDSQRGSDI